MSNILDEIPYIVTPRKDTGLFNSKIAIWLFLASEVMLFGGLFSGYIFLRIYADYPWPERALPITPGFINTFVLIGSSVTVVFAWASLKMRNYRQFQVYMAITLLCAAIFMVLKGFEYSAKFSHKAVRLKDSFAMVEGHLTHDESQKDEDGHAPYNKYQINFEADSLTVDVNRFHEPFFEKILEQQAAASTQESLKSDGKEIIAERISYLEAAVKAQDANGNEKEYVTDLDREFLVSLKTLGDLNTLTLEKIKTFRESLSDTAQKQFISRAIDQRGFELSDSSFDSIQNWLSVEKHLAALPEEEQWREADQDAIEFLEQLSANPVLTVETLETLKDLYRETRAYNASLRTKALRKAWEVVRDENDGKTTREMVPLLKVDDEALKPYLIQELKSLSFDSEIPLLLTFNPDELRDEADKAVLMDDTVITGKRLESDYALHVDTLDFRFVAQKAHEKDLDPMDVINKSWIITENPEIKEVWDKHLEWVDELRTELKPKGQEPNENDLYRVTWQEMVTTLGFEEKKPGVLAGFTGPKHASKESEAEAGGPYWFPVVTIPRERVAFESNLTPKWNTYYAVYFLITGLHGLHVIGGALVLGYFGFCSKKMYEENPEWLANRVEVGGLFWHFVDLVWIFLFPIMYLM